ncbi:MAG: hypothetical protein HUU50_19370 [Candidatus Brocadiae bacterium]|nr:hypothetical protein [Candidatus Brocadiia bacterium]
MNQANMLEKKSLNKKISIIVKLILAGLILFYYKGQFFAQETKEKSRIFVENSDKANIALDAATKKADPVIPQKNTLEDMKEEKREKPEDTKIAVAPESEKPVEIKKIEIPEEEKNPAKVEEILPLSLHLQEDTKELKKIVLEYHNASEKKIEKLSVLLKLSEKWKISSQDFIKKKSGYVCDFLQIEPKTSQKKYLSIQGSEAGAYTIEIAPSQIKCSEATIDSSIKEKLPVKLEISF